MVAAPNISRDEEPIKFLVNLTKPAQVALSLFTLSGEKVYNAGAQGSAGLNTLVWELENNGNQPVASGLYIYVLSIGDGSPIIRRTGKVVLIH